jgi:hypothetical protein
MAAKRIVVREGYPGESSGRWQKAQEHFAAMDMVLKAGLFDSASLLAIHAAIAVCDAFTLRHLNKRCSSERHLDAVHVLKRASSIGGVKVAAGHLEHLLDEKAWIEYSDGSPRPDETERMCEHTRRFLEFVGRTLA